MIKRPSIQLMCLLCLSFISISAWSVGRDPTKPPNFKSQTNSESEAGKSTLSISGVILGGKEPTVIINGKLYIVGDHIQGLTIIDITRHKVVFLGDQGKFEMPVSALQSPNIKILKSITQQSDLIKGTSHESNKHN